MGRGVDIDLAERARGMMVGIAVGNLFGLHWEGRWQELREEQARRGPVREIYAREGFPDDDDLAQAILLAEACLESGHLDMADLAQRFWIWGGDQRRGDGRPDSRRARALRRQAPLPSVAPVAAIRRAPERCATRAHRGRGAPMRPASYGRTTAV